MEVVGVIARIVVGAILVVAGAVKLRTRAWGLLALEAGTPRAVVISLPAVEILLGAALVLQLVPWMVGWLAVALFAAFTAFVLQRYLSGSDAGCNCFGAKRSQEPVDLVTISRNVLLLAIAVVGALV